ncbi:hypothetical protein QJS66_07220 [Kocuria rhizophila]|nr:hypothetical protein QJS66_07220 [Kocuria rhizophila]
MSGFTLPRSLAGLSGCAARWWGDRLPRHLARVLARRPPHADPAGARGAAWALSAVYSVLDLVGDRGAVLDRESSTTLNQAPQPGSGDRRAAAPSPASPSQWCSPCGSLAGTSRRPRSCAASVRTRAARGATPPGPGAVRRDGRWTLVLCQAGGRSGSRRSPRPPWRTRGGRFPLLLLTALSTRWWRRRSSWWRSSQKQSAAGPRGGRWRSCPQCSGRLHLYQGVGPALGSLGHGARVRGATASTACHAASGRAHFLLDAVGFLAPQLLAG